MNTPNRRRVAMLGAGAIAAVAASSNTPASAGTGTGTETSNDKVVVQVSDGDSSRWTIVLNNVGNLQKDFGGPVEIEVVAYGPGIGLLKKESPEGARIAQALKNRVRIVGCQNTMRGMGLVEGDMLPNIGYVPSGVVELVRKQQQGFAYLRP